MEAGDFCGDQRIVPEVTMDSPDSGSVGSLGSQDTCCMEESPPTEQGLLDVNVIPASYHRSVSFTGPKMATYRMEQLPRGLALIIDIEVYVNDLHERRVGSHVDAENLKKLFEGLRFEVCVYKDLYRAEVFKAIQLFRDDPRHNVADMVIIAILSHGNDGGVYAADGQHVEMEEVYSLFNNSKCAALQGKPKFFIVQACRGNYLDPGVRGAVEEGLTSVAAGDKRKRRPIGSDTDKMESAPINNRLGSARPTWEDMIIAYSSLPGYASVRDHEKGTWFIQSLVEVFMNHAHDTELIDLLRMTSQRLSQFTNDEGEKQTCNIELRHLYKRIYFNPGLGCPSPIAAPPPGSSPPSQSLN